MPKFIKYRGAKKVPITSATVETGQKGKKDPKMHVVPRSDWKIPNEGKLTRTKSHIYTQAAPIPRRKKP